MEVQRTTEVKVGVMIGAGLALFMISTLLLGGGKKVLTPTYTLKVRFESVAGLAPGSVVQLLGVPVGNVAKILFVPNSTLLEVDLTIETEYQSRITEGSTAGVRTQGALGDKFIYITPGPDTNPVVPELGLLATEEGGDFFATLAKHGDNFGKVFDTVDQLNRLLTNLNADGKSGQLMPNLVKSSVELQKVLASTNALMEDLRGGDGSKVRNSFAHLESVLKKIDQGRGTLGALINDSEIHERMKSALGGTNQSNFLKNQVRETIRAEK